MRPTFVDSAVRARVLHAGLLTLVAASLCAVAGTVLPSGLPQLLCGLGLTASVLFGVAAMCLQVQQSLLCRPPDLAPLRVSRFAGAMLATIAGPLATAKLMVLAIAFGGALVAGGTEAQTFVGVGEAGAYAGISVAWLIVPMALLVTGTAALKLPALVADRPIDTGEAIGLADGREWSLVPLGVALPVPFLLLVAGILLAAMGQLWGLALLVPGALLSLPAHASLARRWQRLHA